MARYVHGDNQAALEGKKIVSRGFVWLTVLDRDTGEEITDGIWDDYGYIEIDVINPSTGLINNRGFYGSGTLVSIDAIPLVSNLTVQQIQITVSDLNERVQALLRLYDAKQAPIEIYRTLFDTDSRLQIAPATTRFVGFIDKIEVNEPTENNEGSTILTCTSHTQEMTRSNKETRESTSQEARTPDGQPADKFYEDTTVVGDWEFFWGKTNGKLSESGGSGSSGGSNGAGEARAS